MRKTGLDGGHGNPSKGKADPGAVSKIRHNIGDDLYTEEDDITLAISRLVATLEIKKGRVPVLTRTTDKYISLEGRTNKWNTEWCDVGVSIHLNSENGHSASYISTYIYGRGAKAELLANLIQQRLVAITGWKDGGVRVENFHMLRESNMPACLIELGFLSNPKQEKALNDPTFRQRCAEAISKGLDAYYLAISKGINTYSKYIVQGGVTK